MGEKDTVFEQTLKHKGFFNYSDLYSHAYSTLKESGYKLSENEYVEKIAGNGKSIEIEWEGKKKITDYVRGIIKVKWSVNGLTDAQAEINGQKVDTNKGDLKIKVSAEVERDYEGEWEKKPFWKMMRGIYDKYIISANVGEYSGKVGKTAESFVEEVKAYLNLTARR